MDSFPQMCIFIEKEGANGVKTHLHYKNDQSVNQFGGRTINTSAIMLHDGLHALRNDFFRKTLLLSVPRYGLSITLLCIYELFSFKLH